MIILLVILSFFIIPFSGWIGDDTNDEKGNSEDEGLTAFEAKVIADQNIKKWNTDVLLKYVSSKIDITKSGRSSKWDFQYVKPLNESEQYITDQGTRIIQLDKKIVVYSNGTSELFPEGESGIVSKGLTKWTIDSDEAMEIIYLENHIKDFLKKYTDSTNGGLLLINNSWIITFSKSYAYTSDYSWIEILISASSGEIIFIEDDYNGVLVDNKEDFN